MLWVVLVGVGLGQGGAGQRVTGLVVDSTGAIIPGARVELRRADGSVAAKGKTDGAGQFRVGVPAGEYKLDVELEGFQPVMQTVRVGATFPAPITVTLGVATVATSVDVSADQGVELAAPENNADSASVSATEMKSLPVLDGDIVATLSAFLDAGAAGEGGATLIVDGVEMKSAGVAPSAIERVSINQDPYSAQYRQPGRGQIEIVTKSAEDKFHGEATFALRDSTLSATNRFAKTKPVEQRRYYEGYLSGPVKGLRDTTFLFSAARQEKNLSGQVNATTTLDVPNAPIVTVTENVAEPYRETHLSMKVGRQLNDRHSAYLLYRFMDGRQTNAGVGGLALESAGFASFHFDMDLTLHDDLVLGATKLNQFSILFERNIERTVSNVQAAAMVVEGSFQGGGAQNDSLATENNPNVSDLFSWTVRKRHQLKFGVQFPNLGRRVLEDNTNRQGTYTFASLAGYQAHTPVTFTVQQGQSRFLTHYDQPGAFFLDQFQATKRMTVTPGVRYDFQNALPGTMDAVEPRLSVAYVVDRKHGMVVRTGGGIYMRRVGVNIGQQLARYEYAAERSLLVTGSSVCDPCDLKALAAQPPNLFNFAPGIKAPMQGFFGLSVEGEVLPKATLTVGYEGFRGWHALRSVDTNAPLPPFANKARPNANYGQVLQMQSSGIQRSDALLVSFRGRVSSVFSGFMQYGWQHAWANTEFSTFTPQNQYDPGNEYGRTNADQRHRLSLFGTFYPERALNLGVGFYHNSAIPYTITTGTDDFQTGLLNARPAGVGRNTLNGGDLTDLQVKLGYTVKLRKKLKDASPALQFSVSSFNTLNSVNYEDFVGVQSSANFMKAISAGNPRRLQVGVGYSF